MLSSTRSKIHAAALVGPSVLWIAITANVAAMAGISGFSNGTGFDANGGATITGGIATLTDFDSPEARSVFFVTPQDISNGFTATFTYTDNGHGSGATFAMQSIGPTAVGGDGTGLGFLGLVPSAAVEFNLNSGNQTAFNTNGVLGPWINTGGVVLATGGTPIAVTLTYDGTTHALDVQLVDTITSVTFSLPNINNNLDLTTVVGATPFVGFTGGNGRLISMQTISDFQFVNSSIDAVPEPSTLVMSSVMFVMFGGLWIGKRIKKLTAAI